MEDEAESDSPGEFVVVTGEPSRHHHHHHQSTHSQHQIQRHVQALPPFYYASADQMPKHQANVGGTYDNNPEMDSPPPYQDARQLLLEEKKFLLAVERGDLATVRRTMDKPKGAERININCVDPLGRSALLMAIDNENLEMIELLIEYKVETKDALLHAIHEQYVEAVEVLLEHESMVHKPGTPHSWEALDPDVASFTPDITPLILAAHRDNYEIIKILFDRGATLPMPHDVRCACTECVTSRQEDSLRHSRSRINAYRALASPSLIALSSKDPILTAFELSWELRRLSFLEHEFKVEYQELRKQCQNFATSLLDHTRSSYELEVMLNHDPTGPAFEHGERMHLNRLKLAIKYKHKKFVAHPNVQQLLASIWYEGLPGFRRKNIVLQTLQIVWIGFLFPVYSIVYILFPHTTIGQTMRKPFIKFICHSASYVTFLFLLILASQRIETVITDWFDVEEPILHSPQHAKSKRGSPPTLVEWMIMAWVTGLIWLEIKQLWEDGLYEYVGDMWNIIDFITNSLYVATIALRAVAYYQVQSELASGSPKAHMRRENWDDWDPMLISEGLFSAANIFSSLKLVYIFSVNPHLGPLQISLGRMVIDIIKFFFVFALVLFAFACGMNQLLWYYADTEKQECDRALKHDKSGVDACYRWRRFANLFESSQTLFWAVFGLIDLNNFELNGIKSYTRFWGMLMYGSYSVINVVVLLNLLIAMMNHSYQLISERTDVEWKFARSKLWINNFEEGGTVPPPFNVIPTPKSIYYLIQWFIRQVYGRSRAAIKEHMRTIRKKARQASERDFRYQNIMRNLVRRYVTVQQRKADNQGVTEDDVNEIKQDISSFRYELIEILKNSGMNTSSVHEQPQGPGGKKGRLKERRLMKGFNIGRTESFPMGDSTETAPTPRTPGTSSCTGSIRSPIRKLKRAAELANTTKQSSRRRWGHIVDAARTVKHSFARSMSQDSFGSQASLGRRSHPAVSTVSAGGVGAGTGVRPPSKSESIQSISGAMDAYGYNSGFADSSEGEDKLSPSTDAHKKPMMKLRDRLACLSHLPGKLKSPLSFEESKLNAKARRHLYGGKIHTGSLKMFNRRKSGDLLFASQRIGSSKTPTAAAVAACQSEVEGEKTNSEMQTTISLFSTKHTLPPGDAPLTPIPSQPSSSTRSSPEGSPPPQVSSSPILSVSAIMFPLPPPSSPRTLSPSVPCSVPMINSPESDAMNKSCSQEPLLLAGRRGSSPKPSNGSALNSKLPGVQPIGKNAPSGWL